MLQAHFHSFRICRVSIGFSKTANIKDYLEWVFPWYSPCIHVNICSAEPRKLVTDMNVQAFFQQTSSRVLYTMTSKAHGYGEEAITSLALMPNPT